MIKQFKYIWVLLIILSCKTSNEKIKVNAIKLEYNILFNGDNYFNEGLEVLKNNYKENYWEIIPLIEGLKYSDQSSLVPTKNFLKSEEKAIKAIQKSKNEQIRIRDKAYLLMGKSRFYDQRYISALQAFGQIGNNRQEALLWKTMIYLNLDQVALALKLIEEEINKEQEVASINILLARAQSEIINKNYNKALIDLKNLFRISNDKKIKSRSSFISAQIYSQLNQKDSAKSYYSKTLNSGINKSSEIYLESKLRLLNIIGNEKTDEYNTLIKSARYPDKNALIIYYQALSFLKSNPLKATLLFNKSLKFNQEDVPLKIRTYRNLQNIAYNDGDYFNSSKYIDTLLKYEEKTSKQFFVLKSLKNKLKNIVELEQENMEIDSAFMLSKLNDEELKKIFEESKSFMPNDDIIKQNDRMRGVFYYYNQEAIDKGIEDFRRNWGNIELKDNWKMNQIFINVISQESNNNETNKEPSIKRNYKLTDTEIDSLSKIYNQNLLKLGIYYNEFLQDHPKSLNSIQKIDDTFLSNDEKLKSKYYKYLSLQKINPKTSEEIKQEILTKHPNSIYAKRITNEALNTVQSQEIIIDSLQNLVSVNKFQIATKLLDSLNQLSLNRVDQYNLKVIESRIIAKRDGIKSYLESLDNLKLNFPEFNYELEETINVVKRIQLNNELNLKKDTYVYLFLVDKKANVINKYLKKEYYDKKYDLLVSYGYDSVDDAKEAAEKLLKTEEKLLNNKYFVISTSQFINALVFKTLDKLNL